MTPKLWKMLATLGPIGKVGIAPGTVGSAVAAVAGYLLLGIAPAFLEIGTALVIVFGTIAATRYQQATGKKDASEVIIDEVAGQWIAMLVIPVDWRWAVAAFLLFRFFDITKIGPIGMVEKWPAGYGVMADDVVAGIAAALCLVAASLVMPA